MSGPLEPPGPVALSVSQARISLFLLALASAGLHWRDPAPGVGEKDYDQDWSRLSVLRPYQRRVPRPVGAITTESIFATEQARSGYTRTDICAKRRPAKLCRARRRVWAQMHFELGLSLGAIGARTGGRDHTTILHGLKVYLAEREWAQ